ncbi:hypothetical protein BGX33_005395 [Mortierella sp. NVP41]|nr:hypothetical protein BGX33_005395 [Mortierella sp. NVP41]
MPSLTTDTGYFEEALGIVRHALHGRINHTAQTSFANDILCVAAELRSAVLIEQLYLNPNDIERIQSMFHHSLRFNHLDLLSIGDDHIFIIHRELLLEEINTYFSGSEQGLHHVFINVDYLLPQPEILEGSRYEPLDKYLRRHLLPDLQMRIQCWDQAEMCYRPLPTPDQVSATTSETETAAVAATGDDDDDLDEDFSMVTLSGWLKGYPVNYVLPTTAKMMARKRAARALKRQERLLASQRKAATKLPHHQQKQQQQQQEEMEGDQVLPTTATTTASHGSSECSTCVDDGDVSDGEGYDQGTTEDKDEEDDEEEEEEDSSHNSLANRLLVLTEINLSANESVRGLRDHCLLSFSYPASALPVQPPQQQHSRATTTGIEIPSFVQLPTASQQGQEGIKR